MIEFGIGVEQLPVAQVMGQMLVPVGDAAPSVANQAGEQGVGTLFNIIELLTRIVIGLLTSAAVIYACYGGFLLMQSAGNPQMLAKARMQIVLSVAGAIVGVSSFLLIGTGIDFISGASGGTVVDVGDVSKVNNAGRVVPVGSFLGIYGGEAVLCPSGTTVATWSAVTTAGTVGASWSHTAATATTDASCTSK